MSDKKPDYSDPNYYTLSPAVRSALEGAPAPAPEQGEAAGVEAPGAEQGALIQAQAEKVLHLAGRVLAATARAEQAERERLDALASAKAWKRVADEADPEAQQKRAAVVEWLEGHKDKTLRDLSDLNGRMELELDDLRNEKAGLAALLDIQKGNTDLHFRRWRKEESRALEAEARVRDLEGAARRVLDGLDPVYSDYDPNGPDQMLCRFCAGAVPIEYRGPVGPFVHDADCAWMALRSTLATPSTPAHEGHSGDR